MQRERIRKERLDKFAEDFADKVNQIKSESYSLPNRTKDSNNQNKLNELNSVFSKHDSFGNNICNSVRSEFYKTKDICDVESFIKESSNNIQNHSQKISEIIQNKQDKLNNLVKKQESFISSNKSNGVSVNDSKFTITQLNKVQCSGAKYTQDFVKESSFDSENQSKAHEKSNFSKSNHFTKSFSTDFKDMSSEDHNFKELKNSDLKEFSNMFEKIKSGLFTESFSKFSANFGGFPIFTPTLLSSEVKKKGKYSVHTSRSMFEYHGETNSYKFSSEEITQSYHETYGVSEDESDDDYNGSNGDIAIKVKQRNGYSTADNKRASVAESECESVDCPSLVPSSGTLIVEYGESVRGKAYKLAQELLVTEKTYVSILKLIDQVFQFRIDNENRAQPMFPQEMIAQMFCNIKSIYRLHGEFLLPQLETRLLQWQSTPKIGDIMRDFAPFLKMYTEYVKNFDNAVNLINVWAKKSPRFSGILEELQKSPECGNLSLQNHMLTPIQRIPRYKLLLQDYLKHLLPDSKDVEDTHAALQLVSHAAQHANDAMKKIDQFKLLLEVQEALGNAMNLVSPSRQLIKEGKIIKISARTGDHQERYLFLFTDLVLVTSPRRLPVSVTYRLRAMFEVDRMQVLEGDNLETENTFYIRDDKKSIEFYTQSREGKEQWMEQLFEVMSDLDTRKSSLQNGRNDDLGKRAPRLIRLDGITKCMECTTQFTAFRRKHHCHACGQVVCSKCSNNKQHLPYCSAKSVRVCNSCRDMLECKSDPVSPTSPEGRSSIMESSFTRGRGLLEVPAGSNAIMMGNLMMKGSGKTWTKRYFALHLDFVLYSYNAEEDTRAMTATPVPGFTLKSSQDMKSSEVTGLEKDRDRLFKMYHVKKCYYFLADSMDSANRWFRCLAAASNAEITTT